MTGPVRPDRVRSAQGTTYGWVDHRLKAWLAAMSPDERSVYLFLVIAANRDGVSWYGHPAIGRVLAMDPGSVRHAISGLLALDLVAYRPWRPSAADGVCQVLPVPAAKPLNGETQVRLGGERPIAALLGGVLREVRR